MLVSAFPWAFRLLVLAALLLGFPIVNGKFDPYADNGGTIVGKFRA